MVRKTAREADAGTGYVGGRSIGKDRKEEERVAR